MRITIEGGVRVYEALAEWARWAATYRLPVADNGDPAVDNGEPAADSATDG
jgi:hypothetical protein